MPTRNVVLTDSQEQLVQSMVESGRCQNASEVLREGLRLIERREAEDAARLQALRAAASTGMAAIEAGACTEFREPGALHTYRSQVSDGIVEPRRAQRQEVAQRRRRLRVHLSQPAERDFAAILQWTVEQLRRQQEAVYSQTLIDALGALADDPVVPDSHARNEIQPGPRSIHVARHGRRGRHLVLYRIAGRGTIDILRILHDVDGHRTPPPRVQLELAEFPICSRIGVQQTRRSYGTRSAPHAQAMFAPRVRARSS